MDILEILEVVTAPASASASRIRQLVNRDLSGIWTISVRDGPTAENTFQISTSGPLDSFTLHILYIHILILYVHILHILHILYTASITRHHHIFYALSSQHASD